MFAGSCTFNWFCVVNAFENWLIKVPGSGQNSVTNLKAWLLFSVFNASTRYQSWQASKVISWVSVSIWALKLIPLAKAY